MKSVTIKKSNGSMEVFERAKLENSLLKSGATTHNTDLIVRHIEEELHDGMSTTQIYTHAFNLLKKFEKPTAIRYSLKRAIMDLGPSGFPFEDFIAEIFKSKGYTALTGQHVQGNCVEHEVDVVAYNENKLIMCEAKFHNELGMRSDLKVALYVKARFDDLSGKEYTEYGMPRKLDEGWLITNTKFTATALDYGMCNGLRMVSWNFPAKGNLQDMIEDGDLHPITCLRSLKQNQIKELISQNVVLCKTLLEKKDLLKNMGLNDEQILEVEEEINLL
ncbi:MAG: restriction endonuclease [Candidatus Paceibacterota bacterium]